MVAPSAQADPEPMVLVRSSPMGSRLAIGTGLLAGIVVGGLAVGGAVALLPPPVAPVVPTQSPLVLASPTPTATTAPSASASTPSGSASAAPSGSGAASQPASPSGSGAAGPSAPPSGALDFGVGRPAPALQLPRLGGGTLRLADLRGKPVWVGFVATSCPACRVELPLMAGFQTRYAKSGLTIWLVDVKEPNADVAGYLRSLGVSFPVGLDSSGSTAAAWRAAALPMHFWVTKDGFVAAGAAGSVSAEQMAANLAKILPGVTVTP